MKEIMTIKRKFVSPELDNPECANLEFMIQESGNLEFVSQVFANLESDQTMKKRDNFSQRLSHMSVSINNKQTLMNKVQIDLRYCSSKQITMNLSMEF